MTATSFDPVAADAEAGWLAISVLGPRTTLCLYVARIRIRVSVSEGYGYADTPIS
jgi:hypothetical protein